MKKLAFIILCITLSLGVFAHEPDTLSIKDHIFYHYDRSEFNEVVRLCEEALVVYESTNDLFEMAGCYNLLGIAYQRLGRFKEAIESYELCAETMERLKNSEYELHQMGAAAFYDKSIRYTRNNMAEIYFAMGDYGESEKIYLKCIEMLGEPHDTIDYLDQALYLENLSIVGLKLAATLEGTEKTLRQATSVEQAEQALSLSTQYGDPPFKRVSKTITLTLKASSDGLKEKMFNLIEWIKIEMGNNKIQATSFELHSLVEDCIESQKTKIDKKRLTVTNAVSPSLKANDDANTIQLVLRNLLSNAIKYSWPDGEVRIETTKENGKLWVAVIDHGMGISAERQKCLLKDMVMPSQGTQGETGSGIGLMLCKQLTNRNGGQIIVKSQVGNGTTIQFSINPL